uniref:Uncharacterized protein n=1 Tax=Romanomermis culicivorax TaxID=13658 RepID=A0A915HT80_ROMCU
MCHSRNHPKLPIFNEFTCSTRAKRIAPYPCSTGTISPPGGTCCHRDRCRQQVCHRTAHH